MLDRRPSSARQQLVECRSHDHTFVHPAGDFNRPIHVTAPFYSRLRQLGVRNNAPAPSLLSDKPGAAFPNGAEMVNAV